MSEATQRRLAEIAEAMSTPERRVSPMQVAAQLLEEAVGRVEAKTDTPLNGSESVPEGTGRLGGDEGRATKSAEDGRRGQTKVRRRRSTP